MAYQRVTSSDSFNSGATSAVTLVNAHSAGIEALENSAVYNVKNYGATGDGTTDDYTAVSNAISAAYTAGGGTVYFPIGTYRINSQILLPNDGSSSAGSSGMYKQKEIRLIGSASRGGGQVDGTSSTTAAILDLRYSGSDAKIVTLGQGELIIRDLVITDLGTSSTPFILTTNTALLTYNVAIQGNSSKSGATCDQDAIILGGTSLTNGNATTSPFSGYGTHIESVRFSRIRRGVWARIYANAVNIQNCVWDATCGAPNDRSTTGTATGTSGLSTITMSSTTGTIKVGQIVSGTGIGRSASTATCVTAVSGTPGSQTVTLNVANSSTVSGTITFIDTYGAIDFDCAASPGQTQANLMFGNLFEVTNYKYAIVARNSPNHTGLGNGFFDNPASVTGYAQGASGTNTITMLSTTGTLAVGQTTYQGTNVPYMSVINSLSGTAPTQTITLSANNNGDVGATTTGSGTSGQFTITTSVATTGTIAINQLVTGTGIGSNALVTNVTGSAPNQTVTLSVANSGTVSGTLTFGTPVVFQTFLNTYQPIGSSNGYQMIGNYDGTGSKNNVDITTQQGAATGAWVFKGSNFAADNTLPPILIQPNYIPASSSQRMFVIGRSSSESANGSVPQIIMQYDGAIYCNNLYPSAIQTTGSIVSTGGSGQSTLDYQSLVRSVGNMLLYAGTGTNDKLVVSRGVFQDRTLTTAARPTASGVGAGSCYYDTTLGKPVWSDGTNWRDAAGTIV
jgi:hypothetical protein